MATFNFVYPTAEELTIINQDLPAQLDSTRLGMKLMPRRPHQTINVGWWQKDNDFGLMQFRGLDGEAPKVRRLGFGKFEYEAAPFGEHQLIGETEWMKHADLTDPTRRIPIGDLVAECDRQLMVREANRHEANVWTLLSTGTLSFNTPGPNGPIAWTETTAIQTFNATVPWSSLSTSTPLADMQKMQQKGVGHGGKFDASATLYVNAATGFNLVNNSNSADLGGRKDQYGATLNNTIQGVNNFFRGQGLPGVEIYDEGYQIDALAGPETAPLTSTGGANQFQKYINNNVGVLVGSRPNGEPVGEYQITANSSAGGQAVSYSFVRDFFNGINAPKTVPGKIEVYRCVAGGPALWYPNAILALAC